MNDLHQAAALFGVLSVIWALLSMLVLRSQK